MGVEAIVPSLVRSLRKVLTPLPVTRVDTSGQGNSQVLIRRLSQLEYARALEPHTGVTVSCECVCRLTGSVCMHELRPWSGSD